MSENTKVDANYTSMDLKRFVDTFSESFGDDKSISNYAKFVGMDRSTIFRNIYNDTNPPKFHQRIERLVNEREQAKSEVRKLKKEITKLKREQGREIQKAQDLDYELKQSKELSEYWNNLYQETKKQSEIYRSELYGNNQTKKDQVKWAEKIKA